MRQQHRTDDARIRILLTVLVMPFTVALSVTPIQKVIAAGPALSVDVAADRHAISPDIYGMNWADHALAQELRLPVDRWGGNATSRYNWQTNFSNVASDYFYENIYQDVSADQFVDADRAHATKTIMTIPLMGYVSKASRAQHPFDCAFKVSVYGAQQSTDPYDANCGNGIRPNGSAITGNNPLDTSVSSDPAFVQAWIAHFVARYGRAANGGLPFYDLDNEPVLWNYTHNDIRPNPLTYDELTTRGTQYAAAIKAGDPTAKVLGPSDWGWSAYFDTNVSGDRQAHGGLDLGRWYLQQMHQYEMQHGIRVLDYFDEHYYPQANGVTLGSAGSSATQALRLRSTRALWDPTYTDESWIGQPVNLIPRFRQWIASDYPGTKLAIGEYNWGGLKSLNGALAQADVLGIFGREDVDLAALWAPPAVNQPGAYAFRIYRNYDGHGASYGETWVRSSSADQSQLAIYGAQRTSDNALTLMVVNKTGASQTSTLSLANFLPAATAQIYTYSSANLNAIVRQPDQAVTSAGFSHTYAANSITLLVLAPAAISIASLAPDNGPVAGGTVLTINGANFASGAAVTFGSHAPVGATILSSTSLQVITPPNSTSGPVEVVVTNPFGTTATVHGFTYLDANAVPTTPNARPSGTNPQLPPSGIPPPRGTGSPGPPSDPAPHPR